MFVDVNRILAGIFRPKALSERNAELVMQYFGNRGVPTCCCVGSVVAVEARLESARDVLEACWACLWDMKRLHRNAGKEEDVQLAARALGYNVRNGLVSEADLGALWAASAEGESPAGSYEERLAFFNARDADEDAGRNKQFDAGNDWGWFQIGPPSEEVMADAVSATAPCPECQDGFGLRWHNGRVNSMDTAKKAIEANLLPDVLPMDDGDIQSGTSMPGGLVTSVNLPGDQMPWGSKKDVNWRPVIFRCLPAHPYKTRAGVWNWQPDGAFKRALYRLIRRLSDTEPRSLKGDLAVWGMGSRRVEARLGKGKRPTLFRVPAMLLLEEVAGEDEVLRTALEDVDVVLGTHASPQGVRYRWMLEVIRKLRRLDHKVVVKAWGRFSDVIRGVQAPAAPAPVYKAQITFEEINPEAKARPEPVVQWSTKY